MRFFHSCEVRRDFPQLAAGFVVAKGITATADTRRSAARLISIAQIRLTSDQEGEWPEIQAWRRAFSQMGLKPTQYRCASEALLRRLRQEGDLPSIHPLVDLCNAASAAYGIPVAAFDMDRVSGSLEVRPALGDEIYETFDGRQEQP